MVAADVELTNAFSATDRWRGRDQLLVHRGARQATRDWRACRAEKVRRLSTASQYAVKWLTARERSQASTHALHGRGDLPCTSLVRPSWLQPRLGPCSAQSPCSY